MSSEAVACHRRHRPSSSDGSPLRIRRSITASDGAPSPSAPADADAPIELADGVRALAVAGWLWQARDDGPDASRRAGRKSEWRRVYATLEGRSRMLLLAPREGAPPRDVVTLDHGAGARVRGVAARTRGEREIAREGGPKSAQVYGFEVTVPAPEGGVVAAAAAAAAAAEGGASGGAAARVVVRYDFAADTRELAIAWAADLAQAARRAPKPPPPPSPRRNAQRAQAEASPPAAPKRGSIAAARAEARALIARSALREEAQRSPPPPLRPVADDADARGSSTAPPSPTFEAAATERARARAEGRWQRVRKGVQAGDFTGELRGAAALSLIHI